MAGTKTISQANFTYDPQISAFNTTFWKTLSGTDPGITSNKIRINAREIATFGVYLFGDIEFTITVPAVPTAADARSWGFKSPSLGDRGRVEFDITGTTFSAKVGDNGGTVTTTTIPWLSTYTNTATRFRISWTGQRVTFQVNELTVATSDLTQSDIPLQTHVNNGNADNMDVTAIIWRSSSLT